MQLFFSADLGAHVCRFKLNIRTVSTVKYLVCDKRPCSTPIRRDSSSRIRTKVNRIVVPVVLHVLIYRSRSIYPYCSPSHTANFQTFLVVCHRSTPRSVRELYDFCFFFFHSNSFSPPNRLAVYH